MSAVKMIKVMGTSEQSWEDAAHEAFEEAKRSVDNITGIKPVEWSADVDNEQLTEYHTTVEVAFQVEGEA